ncbi:MAG: cobalt-precorrin-6A reductase [Ahrensia sp.]|nr:cobalt-precorrin-6A reductase [Ahrensia sp.]
MTRILILGGTKEAADLAGRLHAQGHNVITSLAGRTREPRPVAGDVRIGGFGGTDGLARWLIEHSIERLVDATHPFALQISHNAKLASATTGIELELHERPPWPKCEGDDWHSVPDVDAAVDAIPTDARVLLALGRQHIAPFQRRVDVHFIVRMIDPPDTPLALASHDIILARPSSDWRDERDLFDRHRVSHILSRNSGGAGAYAKIEAARRSGRTVIMIERPEP